MYSSTLFGGWSPQLGPSSRRSNLFEDLGRFFLGFLSKTIKRKELWKKTQYFFPYSSCFSCSLFFLMFMFMYFFLGIFLLDLFVFLVFRFWSPTLLQPRMEDRPQKRLQRKPPWRKGSHKKEKEKGEQREEQDPGKSQNPSEPKVKDWLFCEICKLNHHDGRRHVYMKQHQILLAMKLDLHKKVPFCFSSWLPFSWSNWISPFFVGRGAPQEVPEPCCDPWWHQSAT